MKVAVTCENGMVFQHFNLISNLTVMDNLLLAPLKLRLMEHNDAIKKAKRLLSPKIPRKKVMRSAVGTPTRLIAAISVLILP